MDLALNNLQWLIYHKTKPNEKTKFNENSALEIIKNGYKYVGFVAYF